MKKNKSYVQDVMSVLSCMGTLENEKKMILVLKYIHGFDNQEIADTMNIPLRMIGHTIDRATVELSSLIENKL